MTKSPLTTTAEALQSYLSVSAKDVGGGYRMKIIFPIICKDGSSLSVQASEGHYCYPRCASGPYETVEIMTDVLLPKYARQMKTDSVYSQIPVEYVARIINKHGGIDTELTKKGNQMNTPRPPVEEIEEENPGEAYEYC